MYLSRRKKWYTVDRIGRWHQWHRVPFKNSFNSFSFDHRRRSCCCSATSRGATGFFGFFYRTALARFPGRCDVFGHAWVQRGWGRLHIGPLGQNPARKRGQASASPGFRTCLATTTTGTRGHGGRGANRKEESRGARWGEATRRKPTGNGHRMWVCSQSW